MVDFKLVISTKNGKSYQRQVKDNLAKPFVGLKIGDTIKGENIDLTGYEFEIRGGSDSAGFPMRHDVSGTKRKKILCISGVGVKKKRKGCRIRKTVCGNTIHSNIAQINLKVTKEGKAKLGPDKEEKKEEPKKEAPKKEEKKAEVKKEEPKKEEKKAEVKPKEEKKEAPKKEAKGEKK